MPVDVRDVVARRGDLSTFVVHLTRDRDRTSAKAALKALLKSEEIKASSPFGHAVKRLETKAISTNSQRVVCFTETPLEYVYLLLDEITGRHVAMKPYGVAIPKKLARKTGVNPVWYVDQTPGHDWIGNELNSLIDEAIASSSFETSPISKIAPFVEQMGTMKKGDGDYEYRKEFWWEREWRHLGDYKLPDRVIILCPASDQSEIRDAVPTTLQASFIDPAWGLERIIASLAGFSEDDVEIL